MITLNTGEVIAGQYTADSGGHTAINIALNADGTLRRPPILVMETDSTPVTLGGDQPGWVSGSIANLGIGVTGTMIFDLGPNWDQYGELIATFDPDNSTTTNITITGESSPNGVSGWIRHPQLQGAAAAPYLSTAYHGTFNASQSHTSMRWRHQGRFIRVKVSGTATAALGPNAKMRLSAHL